MRRDEDVRRALPPRVGEHAADHPHRAELGGACDELCGLERRRPARTREHALALVAEQPRDARLEVELHAAAQPQGRIVEHGTPRDLRPALPCALRRALLRAALLRAALRLVGVRLAPVR